jgi:hypothetical protein
MPMAQILWWSHADINAFIRTLQKYADPKNVSGRCMDSIIGNMLAYLDNAARSPAGPCIPSFTLAPCPMQDNFWQGFGIFVASVLAAYFGGELAAMMIPATVGADVAVEGAAVSAETGLDAATQAALDASTQATIDAALQDAAVTAATSIAPAAAGVSTAGEVLTEITVTSTATGGAVGITAGEAASVAAAAAGGVSTVGAGSGSVAPSQTVLPDQPQVNAPDLTDETAPTLDSAPSGSTSLWDDAKNLYRIYNAAGKLIGIIKGPPRPVRQPAGGTLTPTQSIFNASVFGVPVVLIAGAALVAILAGKSK